jgi:hypothetical protein
VITVTFEDHTERFMELLETRAHLACRAAGRVLRDSFREQLLANQAPPHSRPGEIPHKYNGPRPGGWGDVGDYAVKNNNPGTGFAKEQSRPLAEYIRMTGSRRFVGGVKIGFARQGSHVVNRDQNYLIAWDRGIFVQPNADLVAKRRRQKKKLPRAGYVQRPWVRPVYDYVRDRMVAAASEAFVTGAIGGSGDVPF